MPKIQSNRSLKYDPIKPQLEGVIELKIIEVKDYLDEKLTVVTVEDRLTGTNQLLATRNKTLTFEQIDQLEQLLSSESVLEGTYMERRLQLLALGLLYITKSDENPIYFSNFEDWDLVVEQIVKPPVVEEPPVENPDPLFPEEPTVPPVDPEPNPEEPPIVG